MKHRRAWAEHDLDLEKASAPAISASMARTLSVTCQGKRQAVKVLPMQPLQAIVEQVAAKQKPVPALSDCALLVDGKTTDLSTPLRYANISSAAKLEVTTGQEPRLGIQARSQQATRSASGGAADDNLGGAEAAKDTQQPALAASSNSGRDTDAAVLPSRLIEKDQSSVKTLHAIPKANKQDRDGTATSKAASQPLEEPGHSHRAAVFTREALEASSSGRGTEEYSDDFYDFGLDDYASVVQGYKAAKQRAEAGLKTAKMREQEQLALAARFPHTRIRVFLPDGFVLQMRFRVMETVSDVKAAVQQYLSPEVKASNWYLYVTPPKQVLSDGAVTLLHAKLLPAAKLYLGSSVGTLKSFLSSEAQALSSAVPTLDSEAVDAADTSTGVVEAGADVKTFEETKQNEEARKVPKWLKIAK